jgi:AcrR family transcriptional regulator
MKKGSAKPDASGRRGPRGDSGKAKDAILEAAKAEFGTLGFERATMRGIARRAGVDGALPSYYFDSKSGLFVAALELPVNPADAVTAILAEGTDGAGERLLRTLLAVWDQPEAGAPLIAMLRSVSTQAEILREFIETQLLGAVAAAIEGDAGGLRAGACVSQVLGLVYARYVLAIEPLASAGHDDIVATIGPTLQRYIDGG